ncbi:hypothetical protein G7Y89_g4958 [Cudoniella acicularis]|uniref:NAD(P)-binding protein n=1 Tax=Cudoniella acicularis TaxID=354080 RepID=A0A8H4RPR3_9HELO|nr:hypothetical protein G7Y89_g4958 [Cudoniella acicularis]
MLYGLLSHSPVSFDTQKDIPDLTGKVIAITGGNAGIGAEIVLRLSSHNPAHIYILSRNAETTATTISSFRIFIKNCCPLTHIPLDLSDLSSVRTCAETLKTLTKRLDILFLNAGIMLPPPGLTKQGYDLQFGTNHLGHFLLANLLLPTLLSTAQSQSQSQSQTPNSDSDVRIIVLSSIGQLFTLHKGLSFPTLKTPGSSFLPENLYRYARIRELHAWLFIRELLVPGYGRKFLVSRAAGDGLLSGGVWVGERIPVVGFQSVEEGARNPLWAATAPVAARDSSNKEEKTTGQVKPGEFYTPIGVEGSGTWASQDMELASKLWEWSAKEVEGYL